MKTVELATRLDLADLRRSGLLDRAEGLEVRWTLAGQERGTAAIVLGQDQISIAFNASPSGRMLLSKIRLLTTRPQYGGLRHWFACPACDGRARVLYLAKSWACRRCTGLHYQSQDEAPWQRILSKVGQLNHRLCGGRPKGMRRERFMRLLLKRDLLLGGASEQVRKWSVSKGVPRARQ